MKTIHEYILEGLRLGKNRDSKQAIDKVVNSFKDLYEMITRFVNWRYGAENKIRIGGITGKESWRITSAMLNTVDVKHGFEISLLDESNKIQKILRVGELVGLDNIVFQIKERNNLGKLDTFHMCGVNSQFSNRFFKYGDNLLEWFKELKEFRNRGFVHMPKANKYVLEFFDVI